VITVGAAAWNATQYTGPTHLAAGHPIPDALLRAMCQHRRVCTYPFHSCTPRSLAELSREHDACMCCGAVHGDRAMTDLRMVNAGVSACVDRRSERYICGRSPHKRRYLVLLAKLRLSTCTCSHGGFLHYPDQLVAFHDALLDRVTNCSGLVSSTTFDDLQQRCIVSEPDIFGSTYQASAIRIPLLREGVYSYLASSTVTLD